MIISEYDLSTGFFTGAKFQSPFPEVLEAQYKKGMGYVEGEWDPNLYRVDLTTKEIIPPTAEQRASYENPPSLRHRWDRTTMSWVLYLPISLEEYKLAKISKIKRDGLQLIEARIGAIKDFETLALVRQIILSIAPAARQLTNDLQYASEVYLAGKAMIENVLAARTKEEVDAVVVNWPT